MYRVAQKSNPLKNYEKNCVKCVLKSANEIIFIRQIKEMIKHFVGIKYFLCDLHFDVNNYA